MDIAWTSGDYGRAFSEVQEHAEAGEPWAQLRIAIFYENGWGVDENIALAEQYYKKAITQKGSDAWSNGQMVGAMGEPGYFNQNSDSIIAEYNLANLYFNRNQGNDLVDAYVHSSKVIIESAGKDIFFCCEFAGGREFSQKMFLDQLQNIINRMTPEQLSRAESLAKSGS